VLWWVGGGVWVCVGSGCVGLGVCGVCVGVCVWVGVCVCGVCVVWCVCGCVRAWCVRACVVRTWCVCGGGVCVV